jgi:hypothetical protein
MAGMVAAAITSKKANPITISPMGSIYQNLLQQTFAKMTSSIVGSGLLMGNRRKPDDLTTDLG